MLTAAAPQSASLRALLGAVLPGAGDGARPAALDAALLLAAVLAELLAELAADEEPGEHGAPVMRLGSANRASITKMVACGKQGVEGGGCMRGGAHECKTGCISGQWLHALAR